MRDKTVERESILRLRRGQALIEYALILVLVGIAFGIALAATGPAIGNVFSNTVYNLLGQEGEVREVAGPGDFWLTVTWVADNPLDSVQLATRTQPPPSSTPTPGPSPTPSPVTPTVPPPPTNTPTPSPTPEDFAFEAPFLDTVDTPQYWRVSAHPWLGSTDWIGEYYPGTSLDFNGTQPDHVYSNRELFGPQMRGVLNFTWGSNDGPIFGWLTENFSVRYTREIWMENTTTINFTLNADDGVRLWLLAEGQSASSCSATGVVSGGPATQGTQNLYGDDHPQYSNDCLLIDDWRDSINSGGTVARTVQSGFYTLQVDYYDAAGSAKLSLNTTTSGNVDDTPLNPGGNPTGGNANCNWGRQNTPVTDANSLDFMWEEYLGGNDAFPIRMRCHLELRGYVEIPETMTQPQFVFWDVWDMNGSSLRGWLEVAEYVADPDATGRAVDRDALTWIPVNLHQGATTNYNWTRHVVDLTNVNGQSFLGRQVTFRFVMENGNDTGRRRWYIDDVEIRDAGNENEREFLPGDRIELTSPNDAEQFITSGHWELTGTNALPNPETNCCSWELRPGADYARFSRGLPNSFAMQDMRVHYVELNGWVEFPDGMPDDEGRTGAPALSFYHGYNVGPHTGLEIQYTTSARGIGAANWQVVPSGTPGDPFGRLRGVNDATESPPQARALEQVTVSLGEIPATRYRLRFAMLVPLGAWEAREGWWIDDIYLHREGRPRYLDYPFFDNAESGMHNWLPSGQWSRTTAHSRIGDHSFTDSPDGNYQPQTNTTLRLLHPIDFANNTPENRQQDDRVSSGGNSGGAAVDPVMTFWHRRSLGLNDHLYVEWRTYTESDQEWKRLWTYTNGMATNPGSTRLATRNQLAWEYVHLELSPITQTFNPADPDSSDIMIRFRLESNQAPAGDGVYIDDIQIRERQQAVHRLWPSGPDRVIGGTNFGPGTHVNFNADTDSVNWFNIWRAGGDWDRVGYEQRNGLHSWHDSGSDQSTAPYYLGDIEGITHTRVGTFNILELTTIFDLRATFAEDRPTLYFWTRYHIGEEDRIVVQVSEELNLDGSALDANMNSRCGAGVPQCYEQMRGWSPWRNQNFNIASAGASTYTWQRQQVPLEDFAAQGGTPGQRIRIRFVFDALDNSQPNKRDGWYIDQVTIQPRRNQVIQRISEGAFFDGARNLNNWVTEGNWGLDPEYFRGAGGGPAAIGPWQESFWDCSMCMSLVSASPNSTRMARGANLFLNNDGVVPPNVNETPVTRTVLNINYDIGAGAPRPGHFDNTDYFVGRWVTETPVIGPASGLIPGDYTFITISDDGVRAKFEEIDAAGNVVNPPPAGTPDSVRWNIIYNWTDHARTTDIGIASLENGKRYRITIEWYERTGNAVLIVSVGGSSFSFNDNPKQGVGPDFPGMPSLPNGNSSLILDGTLDMQGAANPVLQYYTYYNIAGGSRARVEVSIDGGFEWTQFRLNQGMPGPGGVWQSFDSPTLGGNNWVSYMPHQGEWRRRQHNLTQYADGPPLILRFRLDRLGISDEWRTYSGHTYPAGWWVVDIRVASTQ
jgi:hypothetical protein